LALFGVTLTWDDLLQQVLAPRMPDEFDCCKQTVRAELCTYGVQGVGPDTPKKDRP